LFFRYTDHMHIQAISSADGIIGIMALDQLPLLAEQLELDLNNQEHQQLASQLAVQLMKSLSAESTGVIVSPEFNFPAIIHKANNAGLLLSLEERKTSLDPLQIPQLAENWGPEHIKNNYGVCKLELYYHPQEPNALKKRQLAAEIYDYCQYLGIDFLLELKIFAISNEETEEQQQEAKLRAVTEFRTLCDAMAVSPPQDPLAMVTVTAELDIPWLYANDSLNYEAYKEGMRAALDSGAVGFVVGHSLWAEMPDVKQGSLEDAFNFIQTTVRDRLIELRRIAAEKKASNSV